MVKESSGGNGYMRIYVWCWCMYQWSYDSSSQLQKTGEKQMKQIVFNAGRQYAQNESGVQDK